jgi:hypothetical protein
LVWAKPSCACWAASRWNIAIDEHTDGVRMTLAYLGLLAVDEVHAARLGLAVNKRTRKAGPVEDDQRAQTQGKDRTYMSSLASWWLAGWPFWSQWFSYACAIVRSR